MAEETNTASAATQGAIGHIVRIVGPVVDVEFAPIICRRSTTL